MARVRELHDRVAVDRVVQRLADVRVLERREVLVELDEVDAGRREEVALQVGILSIWSIRLPGGFSITSTFLFCSRSTRELSFGTIWILTFLIFGFVPYQYGFTARSTSLSFFRLVTMNGPLPTGLLKNVVALRLHGLLRDDRVGVHREVGEQRRVRPLEL